MILFLDFDGVLHPDAVYLRPNGEVELRSGGELFMWAPLLIEALSAHQNIRIVLSTSWARNLGYYQARKALPTDIQNRVIGATWHSAMGRGWPDYIAWDNQSRYEQIAAWLARSQEQTSWVAIDDDADGWPDSQRKQLVQTNPQLGLVTQGVMAELVRKFALTE